MRFAYGEMSERFAGIQSKSGVTGTPLLPDCLAWLECEVWQMYDGGDHSIFVGKVVDLASNDQVDAPLLYYNRNWRQSAELNDPNLNAPPKLPLEAQIIEVGLTGWDSAREKAYPDGEKGADRRIADRGGGAPDSNHLFCASKSGAPNGGCGTALCASAQAFRCRI